MTRHGALLVVSAAVMVVAGCGGSGSGGPSATPATTPSPTGPTATVRQYASVVAGEEQAIRTNTAKIHSHCALAISPATFCPVLRLTAEFSARNLVLSLRGALESTSTVYIGSPPTEVAGLVASTMRDARAVAQVAKNGHMSYQDVSFAQNQLVADLDSWRPYGA